MTNERRQEIADYNARLDATYAALPAARKTAAAKESANRTFNRFLSKRSATRTAALLGR